MSDEDVMMNAEVNRFLRSRLKNVDNLTIRNLKLILSESGCWEDVVCCIPPAFSNKISVKLIKEKARLHSVSPADVLFNELKKRNTLVIDMVSWLEKANLDRPLMLLKPDEPLEIIKQPPETYYAQGEINLFCEAKGFPTPKYQWYKDKNELLEQTFSDLNIKDVTVDHEGSYFCKIYNIDRLTNEEKQQHLFSSKTLVLIDKAKIAKTECLEIIRHPVTPANKVKQGCSVPLKCEAICGSATVKYQWYENGKEMPGETKPYLMLENLYPIDNVSQWTYQCQVYTGHRSQSAMSKEAKVILDTPKDDTQYFAKRKLALLIGNEDYLSLPKLNLPSADVVTLSLLLKEKGFTVFSFLDLTLIEMRNVVEMFVKFIEKGDYVVFYYAGHGFEEFKHYMLPIVADEKYVTSDSLAVEFVLDKIQSKIPALALLLIDMCRVQPDRIATVTLTPDDSYGISNTLIAFATSPRAEALEFKTDQNGFFMKYLKKHLVQRKFIVDILFEVKRDMSLSKQSPWTSGNLSTRLTLDDPCLDTSIRRNLDVLLTDFDKHLREPTLNFNGYKAHMRLQKHRKVFLNAIDVILDIKSLDAAQIEPSLMVTLSAQGAAIPENLSVKVLKKESSQLGKKYTILNIQRLQRELILAIALVAGTNYSVEHIDLKKPLISQVNF